MSDSIKVAIKVRPLIKREKDDNLPVLWTVQGNTIVQTDPEARKRGDSGFQFDHCFDMGINNNEVFDTIVRPIVDAAVNGFNGTVFAYGQTSSGKTYTMMGTLTEPGVVPLAVEYMFDAISNTIGREFLLRVSYLEIYNEKINDLLNNNGVDLKTHEDTTGQVWVKCTEEVTNSPDNVMAVMKKGNKNKRVGETNMNDRSSRSHTIFRITIESREVGADSDGAIQVSQLNLVDLAGSERVRQTGATGERFKEGRHINQSLSTLALVIKQLSESQDGQKYVNFRDSKLTRLLQASLGGNAMTAIICAVTPAALEETQCTLSFASRARSIKNKPQLNEVMSDAALLKRYAKQLAKLNQELDKVKQENRYAQMEEMESKLQEKDRINQLLEERIELLKTRIVSSDNSKHDETFKCKSRRRRTWGGSGTLKPSLSAYQANTHLPTIKEQPTNHRKSIIQSIDIMNETFQIELADFELELIECERHRGSCPYSEDGSDNEEEVPIRNKKNENRVKFLDNVTVHRPNYEENTKSPRRKHALIQTESNIQLSPSTPKQILRDTINNLMKEFDELQEYTTLEKQLALGDHCCCTNKEDKLFEITEEKSQTKVVQQSAVPEEVETDKSANKQLNILTSDNYNTDFNIKIQPYSNRMSADDETRILDLERQLMSFKEENDKYKSQVGELQKKLEETEIAKSTELNLRSKLEGELDALLSEKIKCQKMLSEVSAKLEIRQEENDILLQNESKMQARIVKMGQQVADLEKEKTFFEKHCIELTEKLKEENSRLSQDQGQEVIDSEKHKNHGSVKTQYVNMSAGSHNEIEALSNKIADMHNCIQNLVSEKTDIENVCIHISERLKEMDRDTALILQNHIMMENTILMLETQATGLANEKDEFERMIAELNEKLKNAECHIVESIQHPLQPFERLSTEKIEQENISSHLQAELGMKLESISELQKLIEDLATKNAQFKNMSIELQDKLRIAKQENTLYVQNDIEIRQKLAKQEEQITNLTDEKDKLEKKCEELYKKQVEKEQRRKEESLNLHEQIDIQSTEITELQRNIANLINEKTECTVEIVQLQQHLEECVKDNVILKEKEIKLQQDYKSLDLQQMKEANTQKTTEVQQISNCEQNNPLERVHYAYVSPTFSKVLTKCEADEIYVLQRQITNLSIKVDQQCIFKDFCDKLQELAVRRICELEEKLMDFNSKKVNLEHTTSNELCAPLYENKSQIEAEYQNNCVSLEKGQMASITTQELIKLQEKDKQKILDLEEQISELVLKKGKLEHVFLELHTQLKEQLQPFDSHRDPHMEETNYQNIDVYVNELQDFIKIIMDKSTDGTVLLPIKSTDGVDGSRHYVGLTNESIAFKLALEEDNAKLTSELELKIHELEDVKNDVHGLKLDIEKLQKMVYLLTTENQEISTKLIAENDRAKDLESNFQKRIEELYNRISTLTDEKIALETNIEILSHNLESLRSVTPDVSDDKIQQRFSEYEAKINDLNSHNIELLADIAEKVKELQDIKASKSLLYDHECIYKDKMENIMAQSRSLEAENIQLSTDLIEKIEENENLRKEYEIVQNKLETSLQNSVKPIENSDQLQLENTYLKSELIELKARIETLSEENAKFSNVLSESMIGVDNAQVLNSSSHVSDILHSSVTEAFNTMFYDDNSDTLSKRVTVLNEKITDLTRLNEKLSEMKLSSCSQCTYMKELYDNRRALKVEVKSLNRKLKDLQKKFEEKCADAEALKIKVHEDLSQSICDTSINESLLEGANVTLVEERVRALHNELDILKNDHTKLSNLYDEKCNELEKYHSTKLSEEQVNNDTKIKTGTRIERIQKDVDELKDSIVKLKKDNNEKSVLLNEINVVKDLNAELAEKLSNSESIAAIANERSNILENDMMELSDKFESFKTLETQLKSEKLHLEIEIESLKDEREQKEITVNELRETVSEFNKSLSSLKEQLEIVIKEKEELARSNDLIEHKYRDKLNLVLKDIQDSKMDSENKLKLLEETLNKYIIENDNLKEEIAKLTKENLNKAQYTIEDKCVQAECNSVDKLNEELDTGRKRIIKEIKSLKSQDDASVLSDKTVDELFQIFVQTVVSKEEEIAKAIRLTYEKEKQKLEDENKQSADAEKRTAKWAKELEADIEQLQNDISEKEKICSTLHEKNCQLEHVLREANHENSLLKEKLESLEMDFTNLQSEFEKISQCDVHQENVMTAVQEKERLTQQAISSKEAELESKIALVKLEYETRLEDLTYSIETYKTKNMELKNSVEGFEANEKQLKNIINMKSSELANCNQNIQKLMTELESRAEAYNEVFRQLEDKNSKINEITAVLKIKCDLVSEYKMKLDNIMPEYETLKELAEERKINIECYRNEIENVKTDLIKQIEAHKDKLNMEEIKNLNLNNQLCELNNKNKTLMAELIELKENYSELKHEKVKLEKKMRNSTSKIKVEAEMDALRDINKTLQCNLDGASNRIAELQENKTQLLREYITLKGRCETMVAEHEELNKMFSSYKLQNNDSTLIDLQEKYDTLLQEKNQFALELEGKKLLLNQANKELESRALQIKDLIQKVEELDHENDELAAKINELDGENAVLLDKLESPSHPVEIVAELEEKIKTLTEENKKCKTRYFNTAASTVTKEDDDLKKENQRLQEEVKNFHALKKEHAELCVKLADLENILETKSNSGGSRCTSPAYETNRRRQFRNDVFNQRRQLNSIHDSGSKSEEYDNNKYMSLRNQLHELELELVSKNGKIATLEMQIQSENFPYQRKCKDLEEHLVAFRTKNAEYKAEIIRLQKVVNDVSAKECNVCQRWRLNRREESTQTASDKTRLCGVVSGVVDDYVKIQKLEKEKSFMKDLCRARSRRIKELEDKIKLLESTEKPSVLRQIERLEENTFQQYIPSSSLSDKNTSFERHNRETKENVPANLQNVTLSSNYRNPRRMKE